MFDWLHNGEGLTVFNLQGLSDPDDARFRHAGPALRGLLHERGPRAPELRPQAQDHPQPVQRQPRARCSARRPALDWAGDPIEVENRFRPRPRRAHLRADARALQGLQRHRRRPPAEPRGHHAGPQRLHADRTSRSTRTGSSNTSTPGASGCSTTAASSPPTSASTARSAAQPAASGTAASTAGASRVIDPADRRLAHRNTHHLGPDRLRQRLSAHGRRPLPRRLAASRSTRSTRRRRSIDGRTLYPHMYGDKGWYDYTPQPYSHGALEIYYWSMKRRRPASACRRPAGSASSRARIPAIPEQALRQRFRPRSARRSTEMRAGHDHARHPPGRRPDGVQPGHGGEPRQPDAGRPLPRPPGATCCTAGCATSTPSPGARACRRRRGARRAAHGRRGRADAGQHRSVGPATVVVQGGCLRRAPVLSRSRWTARPTRSGARPSRSGSTPGAGGRLTLKMKRLRQRADARPALGSKTDLHRF